MIEVDGAATRPRINSFHAQAPIPPAPVPTPTPALSPDSATMPFDHERLDVYQASLDFLVAADEVIERFPRGRAHMADQLHRASTSIVLNIAEGAGKFSKPDKRRYYLSARGAGVAHPRRRAERPAAWPPAGERLAVVRRAHLDRRNGRAAPSRCRSSRS
jgi:hypothetical protein